MSRRLLLLTRPECGLCEAFLAEFIACFGPGRFEIERVDVDSREDWRQRFGLKIPVLLDAADGLPLATTRFDAQALRDQLLNG
ncbi:MAG: glutaredoxin family protein [Gammaproteobacteria bacterium]|jgi:hypothetical protein